MTKSEFISAVASKSGDTKKNTEHTLTCMLEVFQEAMIKGDKIAFTGVCAIAPKKVAPKKIINPRTKEAMMTKGSVTLSIKTGAVLKEALNK